MSHLSSRRSASSHRVLLRQMTDFIANVRGAAFGTLASAIIIVPIMAQSDDWIFWVFWGALLIILDGLRLKHTFDFDPHQTDPAKLRKEAIYASSLAGGCGLIWAAAFVVMWPSARSPGEFFLLCVLAAGIMSTAILQYRHLKPAAIVLIGS